MRMLFIILCSNFALFVVKSVIILLKIVVFFVIVRFMYSYYDDGGAPMCRIAIEKL